MLDATTEQVYVAMLGNPELGFDGVVKEQVVVPVTPVIAQVPTPAGVAPFVGPSTVAVKPIVLPTVAEVKFGTTVTLGVAFGTTA